VRKHCLGALFISTSLVCLAAESTAPPSQFEKSVRPFLAKNCYGCHNSKLQSGKLNLESYKTASSLTQDRDRSEEILQKLRTGEMPPKGMPRPTETESKLVIGWIEKEMQRADLLAKPDPGRVTARRLNRSEYNNTIRDLLGITLRPADNFPQDDSGYGFDNIGDVLSLSPVLMEKYLTAGEKAARYAVFGPEPMKPAMVRYQPPFRRKADGTGGTTYKGPQSYTLTNYDFTGLTMPSAVHFTHRFPVDAEYMFRCTPAGQRPGGSDPINLAVWVDGKMIGSQRVDALSDDGAISDISGQTRDIRAKVTAGEHWVAVTLLRQFDGLPAEYGGLNPSKRTTSAQPPRNLQPPPGATPEQLARFEERRAAGLNNRLNIHNIRIDNAEIGGPYDQSQGPSPESLKKIYVCGHLDGHHVPGCDRKIVSSLARRAFRRPATSQETDRLTALVAMVQKEGDSFEKGIAVAISAMLVSPQFLFRIEPETAAPGDAPRRIGQYELASRLSYFLWSSMPDEELLRAAERGALRQPAVLDAQVRRMLKDPKAHALVEEFGGQWLQTRALESVNPDRDKYPDFEDYLRMSMRRETEMFFETIVREDRSILEFIDGKYTFLNERLAQLYGIPGVTGPEFRRVDLSGTQRGGVLTQGSVLTVSSYATRTSPVLRGKWILENLLNAPPPAPPPNVPLLNEEAVGTSASLREQMEKHRSDAVCASCHSRMDPLGFGLENFDGIGGWRTQDGKFPIDSSGALPNGKSFREPNELEAILRADAPAFAECLTDKLLTYALGRGLERYDKPTVKTIARRVAANNYRFSSLVLEIVNSLPFQMRKGDRGKS